MATIETVDIEWRYEDYVEPLSIHVVESEGATVLVGGGDRNISEEVVAVAREHDVDIVLAEHGHIDHYGAIPALQNEMDVAVAIPAADAPALRAAGIEPDYLLEDGDVRWGIEAIATPGHTPGNMAFLTGETILAGDTVAGSDSVFAASDDWRGPLGVIEPRFNDDDAQTRASVAHLLDFDFEAVRVSHGSHVEREGPAAVEQLVADCQ